MKILVEDLFVNLPHYIHDKNKTRAYPMRECCSRTWHFKIWI